MDKNIRIGKVENDFMDIKIEIRRLIDVFTPENNRKLGSLLTDIDNLIKNAEIKKLKNDGFLK